MSDIHIRTFGRFQVVDRDSVDHTPRSQKACAILAILCDAPDMVRPRTRLQDMLWSDRGPEQGAASLRQDLSEIRRSFGPFRGALVSDSRTVGLRRDMVTSDLVDPAMRAKALREHRVFLEDIDIRDPEFEAWLRDWRLHLEDRQSEIAPPVSVQPDADQPPLLIVAEPVGGGLFASHIAQAVADGVSNLGAVRLYTNGNGRPKHDPAGRSYQLRSEERAMDGGSTVSLRLVDLTDERVCWTAIETLSASQSVEAGVRLNRLINMSVDRTIEELSWPGRAHGADFPDDIFFRPTQTMFVTRGLEAADLQARFDTAYTQEKRGIYLAWKAFILAYELGERRVTDIAGLREEARGNIRKALEMEPHNPVILALASHIYSFVLKEHRIAHDLAERSLRISKSNVFGWLFMGSAKTYLGDLEEGYQCFTRAREMAGEGPYRHFVDFFAGMSASVTGRLEEGITILEAAHELTPDFLPPLRYLMATYLITGDMEAASRVADKLKQFEPDFDPGHFSEPEYPMRKTGAIEAKLLKKLK